jgi:hypothetical protein
MPFGTAASTASVRVGGAAVFVWDLDQFTTY